MHDQLKQILGELQSGLSSAEQAAQRVFDLVAQPMGFATLDHDRPRRCGTQEVIYAAGKTPDQVILIARALVDRTGHALVTRCGPDHLGAIRQNFRKIEPGSRGQTVIVGDLPPVSGTPIPLVTAGTSDEPVAEEAELTCRALGQASKRINDVGVAGLPRLFRRLPELQETGVVVCIAGMEGALPSVIGGLVRVPVIGVPTSVGYGAALGGLSALLGMLTSCAAGVTVVNIDNGFGAAYTATLIQRQFDQWKSED